MYTISLPHAFPESGTLFPYLGESRLRCSAELRRAGAKPTPFS